MNQLYEADLRLSFERVHKERPFADEFWWRKFVHRRDDTDLIIGGLILSMILERILRWWGLGIRL